MNLPASQDPEFQQSWNPIRVLYDYWVRFDAILNDDPEYPAGERNVDHNRPITMEDGRWEFAKPIMYNFGVISAIGVPKKQYSAIDPNVDTMAEVVEKLKINYNCILHFIVYLIGVQSEFYQWIVWGVWHYGKVLVQKYSQAPLLTARRLKKRLKTCAGNIVGQRFFNNLDDLDQPVKYPRDIPDYFGQDWIQKVLALPVTDCQKNINDLWFLYVKNDPFIVSLIQLFCDLVANHDIKLDLRQFFEMPNPIIGDISDFYKRIVQLGKARRAKKLNFRSRREVSIFIDTILGRIQQL